MYYSSWIIIFSWILTIIWSPNEISENIIFLAWQILKVLPLLIYFDLILWTLLSRYNRVKMWDILKIIRKLKKLQVWWNKNTEDKIGNKPSEKWPWRMINDIYSCVMITVFSRRYQCPLLSRGWEMYHLQALHHYDIKKYQTLSMSKQCLSFFFLNTVFILYIISPNKQSLK